MHSNLCSYFHCNTIWTCFLLPYSGVITNCNSADSSAYAYACQVTCSKRHDILLYVCVSVCVTVEHTGLPVLVEMQVDLCWCTSLRSYMQMCVLCTYSLTFCLHAWFMICTYPVRGHYYYAVGMYMDVVRKGTQWTMNGIHTSHKFSFVDVWHILCSKMFLKRLKAMNACLPMHGKWRTGKHW